MRRIVEALHWRPATLFHLHRKHEGWRLSASVSLGHLAVHARASTGYLLVRPEHVERLRESEGLDKWFIGEQ